MGEDTTAIWTELQKMNTKLDDALVTNQDFKTWRRGHMAFHQDRDREHQKDLEHLDEKAERAESKADTANEKVSSGLGWKNFFSSLVAAAITAVALVIAALALGGVG